MIHREHIVLYKLYIKKNITQEIDVGGGVSGNIINHHRRGLPALRVYMIIP